MNAFWRASALGLSFIFVSLSASQYIVDPRTPEGRPTQAVRRLSRAMFGEHCLETHEIADRQGAVANARKLWRMEEVKSTALGDEDAATVVFRSTLFRAGGDRDREFSGDGWLVTHSAPNGWHVSYAASNPAVAAYLSADFTDCGRVTNSASKIFGLKR